jgi:hypothetical protein
MLATVDPQARAELLADVYALIVSWPLQPVPDEYEQTAAADDGQDGDDRQREELGGDEQRARSDLIDQGSAK